MQEARTKKQEPRNKSQEARDEKGEARTEKIPTKSFCSYIGVIGWKA
jgi:hypothetical protein